MSTTTRRLDAIPSFLIFLSRGRRATTLLQLRIFFSRDSLFLFPLSATTSFYYYYKDRLAIARRSLEDRSATNVSLTCVLVSCVIGIGLVVLASSSTLYGKVPCLILKKTNRLTQAVVFSVRRVVVYYSCSSAKREGLSTHTYTTGMLSRTLYYAQHHGH